ncbi:MAG: hypothetical protein AAFN92_09035, partial [Bacteroidota bacterium]
LEYSQNTLVAAQTNYQQAVQSLQQAYPVLPPATGAPDYLSQSMNIDPGGGGSSSANQFGENAGQVQSAALTYTLESMLVNTEPELPGVPEMRTFALVIRPEDTDVFTPIHDQVAAIWYSPDGGPDFDRAPLIAEAKTLLLQKMNFLVNE